jgi:hypothetical protein
MEEIGKKRGRPFLIKPWMNTLIAKRVMAEKREAPEDRKQRNILAVEIRDEIDKQKNEGERTPQPGTIEKLITYYRKQGSPEDKPWTIFTLADYPIPPETLPKVLNQYGEVKDFCGLSIREAKWIARLSAIEPPERWPWVYALVAGIEQLFEMVGSPPSFHLIDDILAASVANNREAENEALDSCLTWFGTEAIRLSLEEWKQSKSKKPKKHKGRNK